MNNSNERGSTQFTPFDWTASLETLLFDCVEIFPPIGSSKESNISNITSVLQHHANEVNPSQNISERYVLNHLNNFFNLDSKLLQTDSEEEFQMNSLLPNRKRGIEDTFSDEQSGDDVPRTQSKRPKGDSAEKTKAKLSKLESIFSQVESSDEAKYNSLTDAIYAAIRTLGMKADINSIHDWILKNKQKLDSQLAAKLEKANKSAFKSNIRSTLHNNSVFEKIDENWRILPL